VRLLLDKNFSMNDLRSGSIVVIGDETIRVRKLPIG
jgi:translation elongation factor P/translation initiation factor 5A